jgi:hypothetical protein
MDNEFCGLKFGDRRIFHLMDKVKNDYNAIRGIYSSLLDVLLTSGFWSINEPDIPRVKWQDGETARSVRRDVFSCKGVYLWGAGKLPRYIGMTKQSFNKRFSRYLWEEKSQCNLAKKYETDIIRNGIKGFPYEIIECISKVRLQGAVDFARHDLNTLWFTLFPINDVNAIKGFEELLINVGNNWNLERGLEPLLNKLKTRK